MRNYFAVIILALIIAPAAHGATDTGGARVPAPPDLIGKSGCGLLYGDDAATAVSRNTCVTIQAGDDVIVQTANALLYVAIYRHHAYSDQDYLSVGVLGSINAQGAWSGLTDARVYSYSARNRPQCPSSDKRMDGTIGPVRGTGNAKFWATPQGIADMQTLCGLTVTSCDPGQDCDSDKPDATKPAVAAPVAKPEAAESCAPAQVKRLKVTIKQVGGACASARALMVGYVKTHKDPSGYVCVDLKSAHQVVAKCKSTHRAKRATLITGTWKR